MNIIRNNLYGYNGILLLIIVAIFTTLSFSYPGFFSEMNLESITMGFIGESFIALGMLVVIILRGIDLSVASVLPFSAICVGMLMKYFLVISGNATVAIFLAIIVTLVLCTGIGMFNALLINKLQVHSFIVTLATALTLRGLNLVITDGGTLSGFPAEFTQFGQGYLFGMPNAIALFIIVGSVFGFALANHRYLQQAYFIGGNEEAAKVNGINVTRFKMMAFAFSSLMAGVAGILYASQFGAANMAYGQNIELRVIAAVFIGGASMFGGIGTFLGTLLGIFFLATLYNGFTWTGVSTYYQEVIIGLMLVSAVFIGELTRRYKR